MFREKKNYGRDFHRIRKIIARIRKMMICHFPIAHAILPINPRIINITAIMMNSIPSVRSQPKIVYHLWMSVPFIWYYILYWIGTLTVYQKQRMLTGNKTGYY